MCVGPAARLDRFLTGHDKVYAFTIVFGTATDTDDAHGTVTKTMPVPSGLLDRAYAQAAVADLTGPLRQLPPVYSAVKVDGVKAYDAARKGTVIELAPRDVEVYDARLTDVFADDAGNAVWRVRAHVSAGTYIRSIARDMGYAQGTCAHVGELRRVSAGSLDVRMCASLEALERDPFCCLVDPVKLLGLRILFADEAQAAHVSHGRRLDVRGLRLHAYDRARGFEQELCGCTSGICEAPGALGDGEHVSIVADNLLVAVYRYDAQRDELASACGFATGVRRGSDI